jgi:WD40 repeat protein
LYTKAKVIAKMKDHSTSKEELRELVQNIDNDDTYFEANKIIVESVIYIDDFDLMAYTTLLPRTSTIFVSSTNKKKGSKDPSGDSRAIFSNKLLARLQGHRSTCPPTIYYAVESGCLISADKIEKRVEFIPQTSNPLMNAPNKEAYLNYYQNIETSKQYSADIFIWNFQRDLFNVCIDNPPWRVLPAHVIRGAHYDSVLDIAYLPISQIIVTASADKTIKFWDPVARPYALKHPKNISLVRRKPGIYEPGVD